jgi:8-oxo-dGTP pyrophosphatase MutT (NUDIX family)
MEQLEWIKIIEKSRVHPLPGATAQYQMAPLSRRHEGTLQANYRNSAVMIALCQDAHLNPFIPLIVRNEYLGVHSGQVSFPGGKVEAGDESFEQAAKRECIEEIGLGGLSTIRALTPLYIPVSNFLVHPFVSLLENNAPEFSPNKREVNKVIRFYIEDLLSASTKEKTDIKVGELVLNVPVFKVEDHLIWGATAMMLSELKALLSEVYETL